MISDTEQSRFDFIQRIQTYLTSKFQVYSGKDSNGHEYDSIEEMWTNEGYFPNLSYQKSLEDKTKLKKDDTSKLGKVDAIPPPTWYEKSHNYWENSSNVDPTIDGMLGGFSFLSDRDLITSKKFVNEILDCRPILKNRLQHDDPTSRACECGAGIGRLTKGLLFPSGFQNCDLVEPSPRLLKAAPDYIGENATRCEYICKGLQDFHPPVNTYDVIWIQWVIGYITDWDLCNFLHRMGEALKPDGVIIIKDNVCNDHAFCADKGDGDITRSYYYLRAIINESNLNLIKSENDEEIVYWQQNFPDSLWPVPIIALCK